MSRALLLLFCVLSALLATLPSCAVHVLTPEQVRRTTERVIEHHSFTPPLLRNYYGEGEIPHWSFGGQTVVADDYVRLTPDRSSQVGHLWNTEPLDMQAFEIIVGFRLHGSSSGADGMGMWITTDLPHHNGPIMGRPTNFNGVGIILDTYDNDGMRDNPAVYVLVNSGDAGRKFSPEKDFRGEYVGQCEFDYRKAVFPRLATLRLHYDREELSIFLSRTSEATETLCTTIRDIKLSTDTMEYFISFTAETGGVSDNHDIVFVHTMPVEGVAYDHNIHETATPIEEADKHRAPLPEKQEKQQHTEKQEKQQHTEKQEQQQQQTPPTPPQQQQQQQQQTTQPPPTSTEPPQSTQPPPPPPQSTQPPPQSTQSPQSPQNDHTNDPRFQPAGPSGLTPEQTRLRELERQLEEMRKRQGDEAEERPRRRRRREEVDEKYDNEEDDGDFDEAEEEAEWRRRRSKRPPRKRRVRND